MSSPEGIILEQLNDTLKERGIKIGNKVKLRNDTVDTITYIDFNNRKDFPIVLLSGRTYTIKGKHLKHTAFVSVYDIVDWNYKEPETITPNHPDVSYWDNGFIKHDKGKPMISLIEPKFIEGLADVMTQGATKYGRNNWQECKEPHRYLDALLRHTLKYWDGEKVDTESGKSHLYHIAFNAMALDYLDNKLKD